MLDVAQPARMKVSRIREVPVNLRFATTKSPFSMGMIRTQIPPRPPFFLSARTNTLTQG